MAYYGITTPATQTIFNTSGVSFGGDKPSEISSKASFAETVAFTCIYSVVILCAACGNLLLVIAVWKTKTMRTTTNYLLANISVADLITVVTCIPFVALKHVEHPTGTLGSAMCILASKNNLSSMTLIVSVLTLGLIAVERYHALLKPMQHKLRLTEKSVWYAIVVIWITSFFATLPLFIRTEFDEYALRCKFTFDTHIYWILAGIALLVIFATICYCYWRIIQGLCVQRILRCTDSVSAMQEDDMRNKRRITTLLMSVTIAFGICCTPRIIYLFSSPYLRGKVNIGFFRRFSYLLLIANSTVNPVICYWQNSNYRMAVQNVLRAWFSHQRRRRVGVGVLYVSEREGSKTCQPSQAKFAAL